MELAETWLDELAHRIHFATFAAGEITLHDAYCTLFTSFCTTCIIFMELLETWLDEFAHRIHFATFAAGEITLRDAYCTFLVLRAKRRRSPRAFATPILPHFPLFVKYFTKKLRRLIAKARI